MDKDKEKKVLDEQLWHILQSAPLGVLIANQKGSIIFSNKEANRIFEEDIVGNVIEDLMPNSYREKHVKLRENYQENPLQRRMGANIDIVAIRKSGDKFPIEIALQPYRLEENIFVIAWFYDVSEKKKLQNELENISNLKDINQSIKSRLDDVISNLRNMA